MARVKQSVQRGVVDIGPEMFEDIERFIRDNERSAQKFKMGINALAMLLAESARGIAQEKSRGAVVPRAANSEAGGSQASRVTVSGRSIGSQAGGRGGWQIPVRRISGEYYRGWKVRRIANGAWMLYNDSGHAVFIELGINPRSSYTGFRRRPVLKLTVRDLFRRLHGTRTFERFMHDVLDPKSRTVRVY